VLVWLSDLNATGQSRSYPGALPPSDTDAACRELIDIGALTITFADVRPIGQTTDTYCHVRGSIQPGIRYHVDLPLPSKWNGRLIGFGDPGTDGIIFSSNPAIQNRVRDGYAVVNSNSGHDDATEPGASFAYNNRQAEIDYGYRAVHVSTLAAKWILRVYYGRPPDHSYFDGCSNGGRQALVEAQRFPEDYDGVLAGAPAIHSQAINVNRVWMLQQVFRNRFADNLAFDSDGDGVPEDLSKVKLLSAAVLAKCDANDGIRDGVIDDPPACDFRPARDLASHLCANDLNGPSCFTRGQLQLVESMYRGAHDSKGRQVIRGFAKGTEPDWGSVLLPHAGNKLRPAFMESSDYVNYLLYENDPGIAVGDSTDISRPPNRTGNPPEFGWWQFDIDTITAGQGRLMAAILDASSSDLGRFAANPKRKLLIFHGWSDPIIPAEPTIDYYQAVVKQTFAGDFDKTRGQARLFMFPGMAHCSGGSGPGAPEDLLRRLQEWVEGGKPPDYVIARHRTNGVVDNERKICAFPQRAVYTGPEGHQNDRRNWIADNFSCR